MLLDEISSAMDEETEERIYQYLLTECSSIGLMISVGHRSTLRQYHTHEYKINQQIGSLITLSEQ